jgi:hypothetical protein
LEFTKIAADSTVDAQNQVNDATDNCTSMSDNIFEDLVSPPLVECTTLNEKKRLFYKNMFSYAILTLPYIYVHSLVSTPTAAAPVMTIKNFLPPDANGRGPISS